MRSGGKWWLFGFVMAVGTSIGARRAPDSTHTWQATGTLFEACSCMVPCPCNFGQAPVPGTTQSRSSSGEMGSYCHTIYAYRLKTARYGDISLDGLLFGGGEGAQGDIGFLDSRATAAQKTALMRLALAVFAKGGAAPGARKFVWVPIRVEESRSSFAVQFGESGGFKADILMGGDGKSPIIVENNLTWPVHRFKKGKTTQFDYHDEIGNRLHFEGVNANLGDFQLSGETAAGPAQ